MKFSYDYLLNGILESSEESIILALDCKYCYLTFNENHKETMKNIWGVNIEVGKNILSYIGNQEDRNKAKGNFDRALNGESFTIVEQYGDKSYKRKWYQNEYNPLYDEGGNVMGLTVFLTDISERKEAEKEYRESNKKYMDLVQNLNEGVGVSDAQENFVFVNSAAEKIFAVNPGELVGKNIKDFVTKDGWEKIITQTQNRTLAKSSTYELDIIQVSGDYRTIEVSANPKYENGEFIGTFAVFQDITDKKHNQKIMQSRLNIMETSSHSSLEDVLQRTVDEACDISGSEIGFYAVVSDDEKSFNVNTWSTRTIQEFCHMTQDNVVINIEDSQVLAECIHKKQAIIHNDFKSLTYRKKNLQGHPTINRLLLIPIKRQNQIMGIVGVGNKPEKYQKRDIQLVSNLADLAWDIVERKNTERQLRKNKKKYEKLAEGAPVGILTCDTHGNIEYINNKMLEFLGSPGEEETKEINLLDFYLLKNTVFSKYLQICLGTGETQVFEMKYNSYWGQQIWVKIYISSLKEDETITSAQIIADDITDRKQAEEKIYYLSFHDKLTGLYNRTYIDEEMKNLDKKSQFPLAVIMIDLNGLKLVNDTYGHSFGDEMLKSAAKLISRSCRKEDVIARWGGDEFLILLPKTNEDELKKITDRIKRECEHVYVKDVPVSLALGSEIKKHNEVELKDVLKEAENNMYDQKLSESQSARNSVLKALLKTLQAKSYETEMHTQRMLNSALEVGRKIGLPETELNRLKLVITLHDIGKVNISENTLTKKSPLSDDEWEEIKKHPEIAYRIARSTEEFSHVAEDILAHHERWDGQGYPRGLKGEDIPFLARITTVVDAYEVMSNGRPYKEPMSRDEIIAELRKCSATQFDPRIVETFLDVLLD